MYLNPGHSIKVSRNAGQYEQRQQWIGVRYQGPYVVLLVSETQDYKDAHVLPLSTVDAHRVGWDMLKTADDCIRAANDGVLWKGHQAKESVILTVNGREMNVSPMKARKIAGALLRKSDPADDFQREHKIRMVNK